MKKTLVAAILAGTTLLLASCGGAENNSLTPDKNVAPIGGQGLNAPGSAQSGTTACAAFNSLFGIYDAVLRNAYTHTSQPVSFTLSGQEYKGVCYGVVSSSLISKDHNSTPSNAEYFVGSNCNGTPGSGSCYISLPVIPVSSITLGTFVRFEFNPAQSLVNIKDCGVSTDINAICSSNVVDMSIDSLKKR